MACNFTHSSIGIVQTSTDEGISQWQGVSTHVVGEGGGGGVQALNKHTALSFAFKLNKNIFFK